MTTNGSEERPLPDGWEWTTVGDIAQDTLLGLDRRRGQQSQEQVPGTLPYVKMDKVTMDGQVHLTDLVYVPVTSKEQERYELQDRDILFNTRNSEKLVGKVGIVNKPQKGLVFNNNLMRIRTHEGVDARFVCAQMTSPDFRKKMDQVKKATTSVAAVYAKDLFPLPLVLPPLSEQERIVAEIEKQFTRLDQAVASLHRLQSNLARYKASVLKAACEGRLVPQDPNDEPATTLLGRILAERRAQWQAANPGKKYKEVEGVETAELPDLPDGWVWATLDQCFDVSRGRFSVRPRNDPRYYDGSHPFVQIGDLPRDGGNITQASKTLNDKGLGVSRKFPKGTVLIAIVGATIGNTGVLTFDSCSPDSLVAFQAENQVRLQYLEMYLRSKKLEIRSDSYASGGQPNINLAYLLPYPIAVPPLAEQERIVAEVERRLSVVTATEQAITVNLSRAERLRQAILHRAFTGQLVPQEEVSTHAS